MRFGWLLPMALLACGGEESSGTTTPAPAPESEPVYPDEWTAANPESQPAPAVRLDEAPEKGKAARRLTVDQLRRSIPQLFGDQDWTIRLRGEEANLFDLLSRTLGEADYVEVTESNVDPSPLFSKFMADMAAQLCHKAATADARTSNVAERRIVPFPEDPERNLRWLRLKFHGIHVPEGADPAIDGLGELRKLYADIDTEAGPSEAWLGVCIALVTAPEFMAY